MSISDSTGFHVSSTLDANGDDNAKLLENLVSCELLCLLIGALLPVEGPHPLVCQFLLFQWLFSMGEYST